MIYVGSAESEAYDQILDTIYVGPVPEGRHIFVFQADPPDVTRIPGTYTYLIVFPSFSRSFCVCDLFIDFTVSVVCCAYIEQDAVGVTIVLLTCSYRGQEFVRVGYFINNDYTDPELKEMPPGRPQFDKLTRNILASKPRVTRFKINWDDTNGAANGEMEMGEAAAPSNAFNINDAGMEQEDGDDSNMDGAVGPNPVEARLNENSNSLFMECWFV